jgi:hypothetical protein
VKYKLFRVENYADSKLSKIDKMFRFKIINQLFRDDQAGKKDGNKAERRGGAYPTKKIVSGPLFHNLLTNSTGCVQILTMRKNATGPWKKLNFISRWN